MKSTCPQCGGPGYTLGSLGRLTHYRCRNCGWGFCRAAKPRKPRPVATPAAASPGVPL